MSEIRSNYDWAGEFTTMSQKMMYCTSEEQLYRMLKKIQRRNFYA